MTGEGNSFRQARVTNAPSAAGAIPPAVVEKADSAMVAVE